MIRYSYKEITEEDGYGSIGFSISAFDGTSNIGSMIVMWQSTNACRLPEPELKEAAKRNVFATIQVCSKEFFSDIPVVKALYVAPKYRRQGIASFLLGKAQKFAEMKKFPIIIQGVFPQSETKKPNVQVQEIRKLFWFFTKRGFYNVAISFAMKKRMKMPDRFYSEPRDFFFVPKEIAGKNPKIGKLEKPLAELF